MALEKIATVTGRGVVVPATTLTPTASSPHGL